MTGALVKLHCTTALKTLLDAMTPAFEKAHRVELRMSFGPSGRMAKVVAAGEPTDLAIVTGAGIDELIALGQVVDGTRCDLARSTIGMAVPLGAAASDTQRGNAGTVDGFKRAMLAARTVAMSNPTGGAQSGAHLVKVFEHLGIADEMRAKSIYGPGGPAGLVGNFLLRGEADIGLQQMPELMAVPGINVIGPLPPELQLVTVFAAGISTSASQPETARALIAHLASPLAARTMRDCGLEPAFDQPST